MTPKKKPVDRTPICDPAYLRRIDPVWMPGPVPPRFWEDRANRRDFRMVPQLSRLKSAPKGRLASD